jgi:hypothetical protein
MLIRIQLQQDLVGWSAERSIADEGYAARFVQSSTARSCSPKIGFVSRRLRIGGIDLIVEVEMRRWEDLADVGFHQVRSHWSLRRFENG